jgi:hypothetical protein
MEHPNNRQEATAVSASSNSFPSSAADETQEAHAAAMQSYLRDGEARAFALGNRGPIRRTADGQIHPNILDAY